MLTPVRSALFGRHYQSPRSVLGSARAFWGLRAYSRQNIGRRIAQITRASDSAAQDFVARPDGLIDASGAASFLSGTTGTVTKLYEQVGLGSTYDLASGAPVVASPTYTANDGSGQPCLTFLAASTQALVTSQTSENLSLPFTWAVVGMSTVAGTPNHRLLGNDSSTLVRGIGGAFSTNNDIYIYNGTILASTWTVSALHDIVGVFNGASSTIYVDASGTSATSGTQTYAAAYQLGAGLNVAVLSGYWTGRFKEWGVWASTTSAAQSARYHENSRLFWKY